MRAVALAVAASAVFGALCCSLPASASDGAAPPARGALSAAAAVVAAVADTFSAPVDLVRPDGETAQVECLFRKTGSGECEVVGNGLRGGAKAVACDLEGELVLPEAVSGDGARYRVTAIGQYAFGGSSSSACASLSGVVIPESVTEIGAGAFWLCAGLKSVSVPDGVTSVGTHAFDGCTGLGSVRFGRGLTTIGSYAFYKCTGLSEVGFPASLESIDQYAFCQASGLRTVTFEGDAPAVGLYSFTGSTRIERVLFFGKGLRRVDDVFNSDAVEQPAFYCRIRFYGSEDDALAGRGQLGEAFVSTEMRIMRVVPGLTPDEGLYSGEVPALPDGANLWRFEAKNRVRSEEVGGAQYAYADYSTCLNLDAGGEVSDVRCDYRGEDFEAYADAPEVVDGEGAELEEGIDYELELQRQSGDGTWSRTRDRASAGTVRVCANGIGQYSGCAMGTVQIEFKKGCTFLHPISDGEGGVVNCAFKVTSLDGATGTLAVDRKLQNREEMKGFIFTSALPRFYEGGAVIPEAIELYGRTLTVTSVADGAFTFGKDGASWCSSIELPATIASIGSGAFADDQDLSSLVFHCDFDTTTLGLAPFAGCTGIERVVFYGKRPSDRRYALDKLFPSAGVSYYYTVRFFESAAAVGESEPLGAVTVRGDVPLYRLPGKIAGMPEVYDGAVPDYPASLIDDTGNASRSWYAPAWMFPEVNLDNAAALRSVLADSTYAYAEQMQDAFAIDDASVEGIADSYDYTSWPVFSSSDVTVVGPLGGVLREGLDYALSLQLWDDWAEVWNAADEPVEAGKYRLIATGRGQYASDTRYCSREFEVVARELPRGFVFTANVPLVNLRGSEGAVRCTFQVTAAGEGRTASVFARSSSAPAVDAASRGTLVVPGTVTYLGLEYAVTGMSDYALAGCAELAGVSLPGSVKALGTGAFQGCAALKSVELPGAVEKVPDSCFSGDAALASVALGDGVREIGSEAFLGCTSLASLDAPASLEALGPFVFAGSAVASFALPASCTSYAGAFRESSVAHVEVAEGATSVPDSAFAQASALKSVALPSTLESIGAGAFRLSGLASVEIPAGVSELGGSAFSQCAELRAVVFGGDPNAWQVDDTWFSGSRAIDSVVYRSLSLLEEDTLFAAAGSGVRFFTRVAFYDSDEARLLGTPSGAAYVARGTWLADVANGNAQAAGAVYDGAAPALPDGCARWDFIGAALADTVGRSPLQAVARDGDVFDLSAGCVVTNRSYAHTGSTVNPITNGTGWVVRADGLRLRRGEHYTVSFERRGADGEWARTNNYASVGQLRVVATAVEGSGYRGRAYGYFTITKLSPGVELTASDGEGHEIAFTVLELGSGQTPGKVRVGAASSSAPYAVAADCSGTVSVPEVVYDSEGNPYRPVEVGYRAFYRRMLVEGVVLPSGIDSIDREAFAYSFVRGDTSTSCLSRVEFLNDMSLTRVARNAFDGCDAVATSVYDRKKGAFEADNPYPVRWGVATTRYYTTRFYASAADLAAGAQPEAVVRLKEGSYIDSPSKVDYLDGSDRVPEAPRGYRWAYDASAIDDEMRVLDSQDAYLVERTDDVLVAPVRCVTETGAVQVPCEFTVLSAPTADGPGSVAVGSLEDGRPAVSSAVAGSVEIPAQVAAGGNAYEVTRVGACAFGSSLPGEACASLAGVALPRSIAGIDRAAFMGCESLAAVDGLEDSAVADIGAAAFSGCTSLSSVGLPEGLKSVGAQAFAGSGLARVVLPSTVESLGKRAFAGCPQLREAVFGGALGVDLPELDGMAGTGAASRGRAGEQTRLALLDDYAFSADPRLERVVFELAAGSLPVADSAFAESPALACVVFCGAKAGVADALARRGEGAVGCTEFYAAAYREREDAGGDVLGRVVVAAGTLLADVESGAAPAYAGAVPPLPLRHEWVRGGAVGPMLDSVDVGCRRITYAIDLSGIDGAFGAECSVGGEPGVVAAGGDEVVVSVGEGAGAVQVAGLVALDADGLPLASQDGASISFTMPDGAVSVAARYRVALGVTVVRPTGEVERREPVAYDALASAASGARALYSAWGAFGTARVLVSDLHVDLGEALALAGVRFDEGDSIMLSSSGSGESAMFSYEDLYGSGRFYYPGIGESSADGAIAAGPALCLRSAEAAARSESVESASPGRGPALQLAFGQTAREFAKGRSTSDSWVSGIDSITVVYGPERISDCKVGGLAGVFDYTGKAVTPAPTVTDIDGRTLVEGTDYVLSYSDNVDAGTARVTVGGTGAYEGSLAVPFKIRRAQAIAGSDAKSVAANAARAAYPNGSGGAVLVSASDWRSQLVAAPLSGALGYPTLLVAKGSASLPSATVSALKALKGSNAKFEIVVVGAASQVSAKAYAAAKAYVRNANYITRLNGSDGCALSRTVLKYGAARKAWGSRVIVASSASGAQWQSAPLAAYASWSRSPVVLTAGKALESASAKLIGAGAFKSAVVAGPTSAVKAAVAAKVKSLTKGKAVTRLTGKNRYALAKSANTWALKQGMKADGAFVVNGTACADLMACGASLGASGSVMLPAAPSNTSAFAALKAGKSQVLRVRFMGGAGRVGAKVRTAALTALGWNGVTVR